MLESTWIRRLGTGCAAVGAILAIATTTLGAPVVSGPAPPACPGRGSVSPTPAGAGPWFSLDPILAEGVLVRQELTAGRDGGPTWSIGLDPESFATGPTGGLVVVGTDDGRRSTVSIVDTIRGCSVPAATSNDVIRQAVLSPDGTTLFEHRIRRRDRTDLGIWRRSPGAADAVRVVTPIAPDPSFGPTWSTDLSWSLDGGGLAISTCGELSCRTRVLTPSTGELRSISDPHLGQLVGLTDDRLVVRGACPGLPCPLIEVDLDDGDAEILADEAGRATLVESPAGDATLVLEVDPGGPTLGSVRLDAPAAATADELDPVDADRILSRPFDEVAR